MKHIRYSVIVLACFCLFMLPVLEAQAATRKVATASRSYKKYGGVRDAIILYDYVVEFDLPANAYNIVSYSTSSGIEGSVFYHSFTEPPTSPLNGIKKVLVVAGFRARKCSFSNIPVFWTCNYTGTVAQFANTVRVRYYVP